MEGQHLQVDMARPAAVPLPLRRPEPPVPAGSRRGAEKVIDQDIKISNVKRINILRSGLE